jgi:hypothetical protein
MGHPIRPLTNYRFVFYKNKISLIIDFFIKTKSWELNGGIFL